MQASAKILFFLSCSIAVVSSSIVRTTNAISEVESSRIVNGYDIDITAIPYQASLRRKSSSWYHICGAVLIHSRGILTAGHCVTSYENQPSLIKVSVGTSYRLSGGKIYDVSRIIVHERYSSQTLDNDIALVATEKSMTFSTSVQPIPIATSNFDLPAGTEALVSGFGLTLYAGSPSENLQAAPVYITDQNVCSRAYIRIGSITSGMLCANTSNPARDACQGDSGGPLVAKNHLVGLVSWGENCATLQYPGVYTRVSEYYLWIMEKMFQIDSEI